MKMAITQTFTTSSGKTFATLEQAENFEVKESIEKVFNTFYDHKWGAFDTERFIEWLAKDVAAVNFVNNLKKITFGDK